MNTQSNTPRDGREIAHEREAQVMHWLGRFGWLTARQIGRLVWTNHRQGHRMAQRTLQRLIETGAVLRRPLPTGGVAYVLGQRGARRLREQGHQSISTRGFRDLRFAAPLHRAIANEYAIDLLTDTKFQTYAGYQVYTECEIQRGVAPRLHLPFEGQGRIPDLLIDHDGPHEWIEIERASKSRRRLDSLVAFAHSLLAPAPNEATRTDILVKGGEVAGFVERFRFMCWSEANVRACVNAFRRFGLERLSDDCDYRLIVERVNMSARMIWRSSAGEISVDEIMTTSQDPIPSRPFLLATVELP